MNPPAKLLLLAELLERAYRLALLLQDLAPRDTQGAGFVAAELVQLLDESRVAALAASGCVQRQR